MRFTTLFATCTLVLSAAAHPLHVTSQHKGAVIARGRDATFNKHAPVDYTTYNTKPSSSPNSPKPKDNSSKPKPDANQDDTGDKKIMAAHPWKA